MTNHYDRIAASAPVNSTAAKVTGSGEGWNPAARIQDWYQDQPPTRKAAPNGSVHEWRDYTGEKVGSLTVLGVLDDKNPNRKLVWVCRCVCGSFCTRKSRSIKNGLERGNTFVATCGRCDYQRALRTGWTPNLKSRPKVTA